MVILLIFIGFQCNVIKCTGPGVAGIRAPCCTNSTTTTIHQGPSLSTGEACPQSLFPFVPSYTLSELTFVLSWRSFTARCMCMFIVCVVGLRCQLSLALTTTCCMRVFLVWSCAYGATRVLAFTHNPLRMCASCVVVGVRCHLLAFNHSPLRMCGSCVVVGVWCHPVSWLSITTHCVCVFLMWLWAYGATLVHSLLYKHVQWSKSCWQKHQCFDVFCQQLKTSTSC